MPLHYDSRIVLAISVAVAGTLLAACSTADRRALPSANDFSGPSAVTSLTVDVGRALFVDGRSAAIADLGCLVTAIQI